MLFVFNGATERRGSHCMVVQKLRTVGFPLRAPEISGLNKELCVCLAWFTGNTSLDQCVWPGPATCWVSRRLREMAGLWVPEWLRLFPLLCYQKSVGAGGGDSWFIFTVAITCPFRGPSSRRHSGATISCALIWCRPHVACKQKGMKLYHKKGKNNQISCISPLDLGVSGFLRF